MSNVKKFFEAYADISVSGNVENNATFYSESFSVIVPNRSYIYNNDSEFLKWLRSVHAFNQKTGLIQMIVQEVTVNPFGKNAIHASVTWGAIYEKTKDEVIEFTIHYLLQRQDSELKIVLYSSDGDQEEVMQRKGLL